ncbi:DUF6520 family protein [Flavobacterium pectinovorum]|uniref:DUF6520 family protein n=1 Tax=Flavobacterium pectinovorum TaxID=29533 RepID=UPI001FAC7432|nr:DUF6520 family protein [Flavobacterium pectinovorum]MCI9844568.1 hypothetical protein [Flavobacterium pectinovorum]
MKTLFLKNVTPFAVVALGIFGAFATMSMQNAEVGDEIGYTLNSEGACNNVEIDCSTVPAAVCRANGATGAQAFGKDNQDECTEILYKP